jgi:hypothetical protein
MKVNARPERLVEKLIPVEELLEDEREAVESSDEVVGEEEIMKVLRRCSK